MSRPQVAPEPAPRRIGTTPEQIVDIAARLFASDGYHEVGIREVAAALNIRGASIYHHFESKEAILHAICLTVTREPVREQLPLLDAAGTPTERLTALVRAHVLHLVRRQVEHLVGRREMAALTPEHRTQIDDYRRYYHRRVRDTVTAGVRSGELAVPDPDIATLALLDMLNGSSGWYRPNGRIDAEALAEQYVILAIPGLLRGNTTPA